MLSLSAASTARLSAASSARLACISGTGTQFYCVCLYNSTNTEAAEVLSLRACVYQRQKAGVADGSQRCSVYLLLRVHTYK